jgi:hypothetical protein
MMRWKEGGLVRNNSPLFVWSLCLYWQKALTISGGYVNAKSVEYEINKQMYYGTPV